MSADWTKNGRSAYVRRPYARDGHAFRRERELDLRATEAVVERFIVAGVSDISPLGSTGEATHLTFEERKRFAEEVVYIVGGRLPLVVGVGTSGTRETIELARHAEGAGVDAGLWSSRLPTGRWAGRPYSDTSRPWPGR